MTPIDTSAAVGIAERAASNTNNQSIGTIGAAISESGIAQVVVLAGLRVSRIGGDATQSLTGITFSIDNGFHILT